MRTKDVVETRRDRKLLAADAGFGPISVLSVLAGSLVAFGCFALLLALAGGVLGAAGMETDFSANDWRNIGVAGGVVVAVAQFISYLFGGYAAGRMSRRSGLAHGFLVFLTGLAVVAVAAAIVRAVGESADTDQILGNLRSVGIPTSGDEWSELGTVVGIGSLLAMLLGGLLGGSLGERWHSKLLNRALDPEVGTEGDARSRAYDDLRLANERGESSNTRVARATGDSTVTDRRDVIDAREDTVVDARDSDRDGDTLDDDMERLRGDRR
jgi:hypothetical protein